LPTCTKILFVPLSLVIVFQKCSNQSFTLSDPFVAIGHGIVEILLGAHTKDAAVVQLLCQRDHIKVKESDLALVPIDARIHTRTTCLVRSIAFHEKLFIPALVYVPMLHSVRD